MNRLGKFVGLASVAAVLLITGRQAAGAQKPALAATPPMGWNSWNHFSSHVTDADVRSAADALVSTGMRDAGYIYVNLDDTWQGKRDVQGVLHPNERFPNMKALADYVHSKGLKFGIYSSPGAQTCGRYEGSLDHEAQDAKMYADWGVDFLKYDLCSLFDTMRKITDEHGGNPTTANQLMIAAYKKMGDALKVEGARTGRPILYSLCQYGAAEPWIWGPKVGASMWRTTDDITDNYMRMRIIGSEQADLAKYAGPGHWNDPDMLEIGNGKMNETEDRTHMSYWVMLAAPLLAGNDLSRMSNADKAILMNREAIAIDQDALGRQGTRLYQRGDFSVWTKPLTGGRMAVGLFNGAWGARDVGVELATIGLGAGPLQARDVWGGKDLGRVSGLFSHLLPGHGSMLLIVSR